ncbi:uncharacterized protein PHACADRAFT_260824 [Phanerochaete carnosa HHB-10118-sp]|uniref:Cytochrome P450 n=1 Tax=Phanerochaete carnosa (strain HHB-10118-sp) TaxID=650164 RepID=K5WQ19_PHACS|nr:uncharacterized protein PHACADRAFT_260824 [Phanerochaete carnosa HHB-10118-sp]EKM52437.1 hypothetical protein PHACADRAFT_260824 [Phanerochaete carnosa HHB-10118-sp]
MELSTLLYLVAAVYALTWASRRFMYAERCLEGIPTVGGPSLPILSWYGAIRFLLQAHKVLEEGYTKYKGGCFKVAQFNRWFVIVADPALNEELRKAPEEYMSSPAALHQYLQGLYTLGIDLNEMNNYIELVREQLLRHVNPSPSMLYDEMIAAFQDIIPQSDDWAPIPALDASFKLFFRVSNRAFVGAPLCSNPEYNELNIEFTNNVFKGALLYNALPNGIRPFISRWLDLVGPSVERGMRFIQPHFEQRQKEMEAAGKDWVGKEDDLLSLLMASTQGEACNVRNLTRIMLIVNLAAVHTTSQSFTHLLYLIATNPAWAATLREEIEQVIEQHGYDKEALHRMRRLDSFIQESLRFNGLGALASTKLALQDFALSNGTILPKGTLVAAPLRAMHYDGENYADADTFQPWRFYRELEEFDGEVNAQSMTTTTPTYLSFGHGKTACPGRFFAALELKMIVANLLLNYDIKLEGDSSKIPPVSWYITARVPNMTANVLVRRRQKA